MVGGRRSHKVVITGLDNTRESSLVCGLSSLSPFHFECFGFFLVGGGGGTPSGAFPDRTAGEVVGNVCSRETMRREPVTGSGHKIVDHRPPNRVTERRWVFSRRVIDRDIGQEAK